MNDATFEIIAQARALEGKGRAEEAMLALRRALTLAPKDAGLLTAFGRVLTALERWNEAADAFAGALASTPLSVDALFGAGQASAARGDITGARGRLEQVLALAPDHVEARATMANLLARSGDPQGGRREAETTLELAPGHAVALAALAAADVGEGAFVEAEARLRFMLEPPPPGADLQPLLHAACVHLLADALHGQGRYAEAFADYERANRALLTLRAAWAAPAAQFRVMLERLASQFERGPPLDWSPHATPASLPPVGAKVHVFLVGFHRSGTTLLEQVLAGHPGVVTLEEKDLLAEPARRFLLRADGLATLAGLNGDAAARLASDYWRRVRKEGVDVTDKVFVDKMPLDVINMPIIAKLFPGARILFARRDPRDVVLSAFRQFFAVDAATYAMLTLEGAADLYDLVMRLATLYRSALPLPVYEARHERLVKDFDGETRRLCAFLDLEWTAAMADFAIHARRRAIATPSASQVRRGLYREDTAPWRRYRTELAPVLPILAPWVERFGYPLD